MYVLINKSRLNNDVNSQVHFPLQNNPNSIPIQNLLFYWTLQKGLLRRNFPAQTYFDFFISYAF